MRSSRLARDEGRETVNYDGHARMHGPPSTRPGSRATGFFRSVVPTVRNRMEPTEFKCAWESVEWLLMVPSETRL